MNLQDGDTAIMGNERVEVVGVRRDSYDVFRFLDNSVIRNVHPEFLSAE